MVRYSWQSIFGLSFGPENTESSPFQPLSSSSVHYLRGISPVLTVKGHMRGNYSNCEIADVRVWRWIWRVFFRKDYPRFWPQGTGGEGGWGGGGPIASIFGTDRLYIRNPHVRWFVSSPSAKNSNFLIFISPRSRDYRKNSIPGFVTAKSGAFIQQ